MRSIWASVNRDHNGLILPWRYRTFKQKNMDTNISNAAKLDFSWTFLLWKSCCCFCIVYKYIFETLCAIVFVYVGWRNTGEVGVNCELLDMCNSSLRLWDRVLCSFKDTESSDVIWENNRLRVVNILVKRTVSLSSLNNA